MIDKILNSEEIEEKEDLNDNKTPRILIVILGVIVACAVCVFFADMFHNLKGKNLDDVIPPTVSEIEGVVEAGKKIPALDKQAAQAEANVMDKQGYGYSGMNASEYGMLTKVNGNELTIELYDDEDENKTVTIELVGITSVKDVEKALKENFKGKNVLIEYEHNDKRKAYVYTTDGEMIQTWLISNGYAEYDGSKIYHRDILKKAGEK